MLTKELKQEDQDPMTNYGMAALAMPECLTASVGFDELICGSRHITIDELSSTVLTSKGRVMAVTEGLDCSLVCAGGMPQVHTNRQEKQSPLILHP
jgi:hypothetical protein